MSQYYNISPQLYDDQFWWKVDDIEFWKSQLLNQSNKSILELASGTGRLALPLIREGAQYTGLDINHKYIEYSKIKTKNHINNSAFITGDMTKFDLKKKFDFIIIGFNSFLHLLTEKEAEKCLQCIKKHMKGTSLLYLDLFVPRPPLLYRPKNKFIPIMDFYDSVKGKNSKIEESVLYNSITEIADICWQYIDENNNCYQEFKFQMKMFYPDTMNKILINCGFNIINMWGSYEMTKFNESSNLQIYICKSTPKNL